MSEDEREAYNLAIQLIEVARESSAPWLDLRGGGENGLLRNLTALPSEISTLFELTFINISGTSVSDITPLRNLTRLQNLYLSATQVSDIAPLRDHTELRTLDLCNTKVSDIGPLRELIGLERLLLDQLPVDDLSAILGLTDIQSLSLADTQVNDLRPILKFPKLRRLFFDDTPFANATQKLTKLSKLGANERPEECVQQTIAYLKTLPPWPEPLPWEVEATPPEQEQALPLTLSKDNKVQVLSTTPEGEEATDPIKEAVLDELLALINDLIRIAGNKHYDIYRAAQSLKGRIDKPLSEIEMLKTHMAIEGLKRILSNKGSRSGYDAMDSGCTTALQAVIETGPALTLDNPQVNVFIERQTRNQLRLLEEAQTAASIALAEAIRDGEDQFEDEVRQIAASGAAPQSGDQLTNASPWISRNAVIVIGRWVGLAVTANFISAGQSSLTAWLVSNETLILAQAQVWGQPFVAWISPILIQASEARAAALAVLKKNS